MFKGKFLVLSVIAAALLSWQVMPMSVDSANSGVVDPCSSTATGAGCCLVICPQGDGDRLDACGSVISIVAKDGTGTPLPGILAADVWLIGWGNGAVLCGGSGSINADSATNANGETTISGDWAAGGCDTGVQVVVQGTVIADPNDWNNPLCLPVIPVSPDITGPGDPPGPPHSPDLVVDLIDLTEFAGTYTSPPNAYDPCKDFNCDGVQDIVDFSIFAQHYLHQC